MFDDEKWGDLKGDIKDKFKVLEDKTEDLEDTPGQQDILEFIGPLGKMRLLRIVKPLILDKKTNYSRRIGSSVKVDYVYSETEKTYDLKAYKWDENNEIWEEIKGAKF